MCPSMGRPYSSQLIDVALFPFKWQTAEGTNNRKKQLRCIDIPVKRSSCGMLSGIFKTLCTVLPCRKGVQEV